MARQVTVTLSDDEYAALAAQAAAHGEAPESLLREAIVRQFGSPGSVSQSVDSRTLQEYLLRTGVIDAIPTGEAETPAEAAERERLAQLFGQGRPVSELVIEDRGPRIWRRQSGRIR